MPDDLPTAPPAKSRKTLAWSIQKTLAMAGLAIGVIGSFLPWASLRILIATVDFNGTDGDGRITLAMFLVAAISLLIATGWAVLTVALVATLVGLGVAVYDFVNVSTAFTATAVSSVSVGVGLYLCILGSTVASWGIGSLIWSERFRH